MAETKPKRARAPRKSRAKKAPAKKPAPAPAPVVEPVVEAAPVVDETPVQASADVAPPTRRELKAAMAEARVVMLRAMDAALEAARSGRYGDAAEQFAMAGVAAADAHAANSELK
jgi:hypothetical protein